MSSDVTKICLAGVALLGAFGCTGSSRDDEAGEDDGPPLEATFVRAEGEELVPTTPHAIVSDLEPPVAPGAPWTIAGSLYDPATGEWTAALWQSADAVTWERSDVPPADASVSEVFEGIVDHEGERLAVGTVGSGPGADAAVWRQSGDEWERIAVDAMGGDGAQFATRAVSDGTRVLVLGHDEVGGESRPRLWLGDGGDDWQAVDGGSGGPFDAEGDEHATGIAASGSGFVAVGYRDREDDIDGLVWVSADGEEWRLVEPPAPAGAARWSFTAVDAHDGVIVAAGVVTDASNRGRPATWSSADGRTWEGPTAPPLHDDGRSSTGDLSVSEVVASGNGWLASGGDDWRPHLWRSDDGRSWSLLPNPVEGQFSDGLYLSDVAMGDGAVVAIGDGPAVLRLGGDRWDATEGGVFPNGGWWPDLAAVVTSGDSVVAAGYLSLPATSTADTDYTGAVWRLTDDGTWQRDASELAEGPIAGLAATAPGLVAVGQEERAGARQRGGDNYDPDGIVWREQAPGRWERIGIEALPPAPGAFPPSVPPVGGPGTSMLNDVVGLAQGYIAAGAAYGDDDQGVWQGDGIVAVSADGNGWTGEDALAGGPGDQELAAVCSAADGAIAAVGSSYDGVRSDAVVRHRAPDGAWSVGEAEGGAFAEASHGVTDCAAGDGGYLAVGWVEDGPETDAIVWASADGRRWSRVDDDAFGGGGNQGAGAVVAVPGGGWLVGGYERSGADADVALWRIAAGGAVSRRDEGEEALGGRGDQSVYDMVVVGDGVVVVGDDHNRVGLWESPVIDR